MIFLPHQQEDWPELMKLNSGQPVRKRDWGCEILKTGTEEQLPVVHNSKFSGRIWIETLYLFEFPSQCPGLDLK